MLRKPAVKIGPITYTMHEVERLQSADGRNLYGEIDYAKCEIRLEANMAPAFKAVVLWHEILHGILESCGHRGDHDESLLDQLAYGIAGVLRDNPEMGR